MPVDLTTRTFNDEQMIIGLLVQDFDGGAFTNSTMAELFYDENGNDSLALSFNYNEISQTWEPTFRLEGTYNAENLLASNSIFVWDSNTLEWLPARETEFFYENQELSKTLITTYFIGGSTSVTQDMYFRDADNELDLSLIHI